jgi:tetratricopeptide (TPR) repeat protein
LREWLKTVPSKKTGAPPPPLMSSVTVSGTQLADTSPLLSNQTSSAEYFVREIKTHRALVLAALVVFLGSAIGLTYFFRNRISSSLFSKDHTISAAANPTANRGTTNDEAYRYYLQGKILTNQRSAEANKKAIENFEAAIRIDPNYAGAYAGLAKVHHLGGLGRAGGIENEKAKQVVKTALDLDPNLAEAYAVRGAVSFAYDWDFAAAEHDLTTAVQLDPNNDTALWGHATLCAYSGRFEQALKEIETVQTVTPGFALYERERGRILYYARRYDEAIVQFSRSIELKSDVGATWLSRAYEMKGDYAAAFEAFMKAQENPFMSTHKDPQRIEAFRTAYETAGWHGVKRKFLEFSMLDEQNGKAVNNYQIAIAFAQLGEQDRALEYLKKLVEERSWQIATLYVDPQVDPLRGDPRFNEMLKRIRR